MLVFISLHGFKILSSVLSFQPEKLPFFGGNFVRKFNKRKTKQLSVWKKNEIMAAAMEG